MGNQETAEKQRGRPFKKGQSGNTAGRPPKGYSITDWFKNMLNSRPEVKDAIGNSILKKALEGDTTAQKLVWNYLDGMPTQATEVTGLDGKPIETKLEISIKHV